MEVPVKHSEDMKLASECLQMNEIAWEEFLDKYKGLCFYLAKKYNSENDFGEIFSDFIVELIGSPFGKKGALKRYDGSGTLKSFIASVFRFVLIDRQRKKVIKISSLPENGINQIEDPQSLFQQLISREERQLLSKAISTLTKNEQKIIILYYFDELSIRSIAEITGIGKSTVDRKLKAILKKLKKMINVTQASRL